MENIINIQIKCPIKVHNEIEEHCINHGITLTKYFLNIHDINFVMLREKARIEALEGNEEAEEKATETLDKSYKKKGNKK